MSETLNSASSAQPSLAKKKFLYNLKRTDYEREWGKGYQKPGVGARILATFFRLIPKIGPFNAVGFKMPSPETETLYLKSVNNTVVQYGIYLQVLEGRQAFSGQHGL